MLDFKNCKKRNRNKLTSLHCALITEIILLLNVIAPKDVFLLREFCRKFVTSSEIPSISIQVVQNIYYFRILYVKYQVFWSKALITQSKYYIFYKYGTIEFHTFSDIFCWLWVRLCFLKNHFFKKTFCSELVTTLGSIFTWNIDFWNCIFTSVTTQEPGRRRFLCHFQQHFHSELIFRKQQVIQAPYQKHLRML